MNITIRNIPEDVIEKIRTLSKIGRRSLNNEILIILEKAVQYEIDVLIKQERFLSKEIQLSIWKKLANEWEDDRSTEEIIEEIYNTRTLGREIEL